MKKMLKSQAVSKALKTNYKRLMSIKLFISKISAFKTLHEKAKLIACGRSHTIVSTGTLL